MSSHLRLDTTEYDRFIRTYILHYDESRGVQLDLLAAALALGANHIIDLGCGTGSLAEAILDRWPGGAACRTHQRRPAQVRFAATPNTNRVGCSHAMRRVAPAAERARATMLATMVTAWQWRGLPAAAGAAERR